MRFQTGLLTAILCCSFAWAQTPGAPASDPPSASTEMKGMSHHDMETMPMGKTDAGDNETSVHVMHSMEGPYGHGAAHENDSPSPAEGR
jgi:hypothetical protein